MKNIEKEKTEVISYSGYRGEEHPLFIITEGERIPVLEWVGLGTVDLGGVRKRIFKVKTRVGIFECHYFEDDGRWSVLKID